jgi:hypothetical protein
MVRVVRPGCSLGYFPGGLGFDLASDCPYRSEAGNFDCLLGPHRLVSELQFGVPGAHDCLYLHEKFGHYPPNLRVGHPYVFLHVAFDY